MHLYLLMLRFEDAFQAVNASLKYFHGLEGCISPWKSIPQRIFHRIEMLPPPKNILSQGFHRTGMLPQPALLTHSGI